MTSTPRPRRSALADVPRILGGGVLAGALALGVDLALAVLTLRYSLPLPTFAVAAYLGSGVVAALVVEVARRLVPRPPLTFPTLLGAATFLLYLPPLCERLSFVLGGKSLGWVVAACALAAVGSGVWAAMLSRVIGASGVASALLLAAGTIAAGLAVNRNLVSDPLSLLAFLADVAVVAGMVFLAALVRLQGPKRIFGGLAALLFVGSVFTLWEPESPSLDRSSPPRPHLIFLSIDTLRQDVFSSVVEKTPEGRAFHEAMGGTLWFENAQAAAPWTAPSVASVMTGLFPQEHGLTKGEGGRRPLTRLPRVIPTLAEVLQETGYATHAIVANPLLIVEAGFARGFEVYDLLKGVTTKLPLLTALHRAGLVPQEIYQDASFVHGRLRHRVGSLVREKRPVFLWLHLMDPHGPLHPHPQLPVEPEAASLAEKERLYREETRFALAGLTHMIETLRAHGLWDEAWVVFFSDHGEMFDGDGHQSIIPGKGARTWGHGHALYEELVGIPLGLRPPGGLDEARSTSALASHVDVRDTVIDALGVRAKRFPGRVSLAPLARGEEAPSRTEALLGGLQFGTQRGVRTERFKLIHHPRGEQADELYDLRDDPRELRDLAAERPGKARHVRGLLDRKWAELAPTPETGEGSEVDVQVRERLKALGYLD